METLFTHIPVFYKNAVSADSSLVFSYHLYSGHGAVAGYYSISAKGTRRREGKGSIFLSRIFHPLPLLIFNKETKELTGDEST